MCPLLFTGSSKDHERIDGRFVMKINNIYTTHGTSKLEKYVIDKLNQRAMVAINRQMYQQIRAILVLHKQHPRNLPVNLEIRSKASEMYYWT